MLFGFSVHNHGFYGVSNTFSQEKHQHFHADRQLVTKKEISIKINLKNNVKVARKGSCFFRCIILGVKIFRLELTNHDQVLPQNNDNIKVSMFCRFLKKFVAMATQLGFEV